MNRSSNPWLTRFAPFLRWWPKLTGETLKADLIAGIIGAVIVLPQGVAFATLAGLPPQYGLYAAMVPAAVAALWGSSFHLVSGPTNAISLVVLATVSQIADPGSGAYVDLVLTLTFLVGAMQLVMGLARLGVVVNFVSHTVVVGFTAGVALLIIASQVRNFFGIPIPRGMSFLATLHQFFIRLPEINLYVVAVGALSLMAGLAARRWLPRVPYMIVAMVAGSVFALVLNSKLGSHASGIATLGALPSALPQLSTPTLSLDTLSHLTSAAFAVTVLGLTEAISIARSVALKSGQRIDANQEFIGQALSNIAGSFFSAYPSSGSFNRSGANFEAGARTPLAAAFAAVALAPLLLLVAPLAAYLPNAAMAAILFLVAWGLIDFRHIRTLVTVSRSEAAVLGATFAATLFMHLEFAVLVGVTLSLLQYLSRTSRPSIRSLVPGREDPRRRIRERSPGEADCPQMRMIRIEGSIYFGAVNHVGEYLDDIAERRPQQKHVLLMAKSINFVDVAGAELLAHEARSRRDHGGSLNFHGVREAAARLLHQSPYIDAIGDKAFFDTRREAIAGVVATLDPTVCATCRVRLFNECANLPGGASDDGAHNTT